jgi:hypothetical protein
MAPNRFQNLVYEHRTPAFLRGRISDDKNDDPAAEWDGTGRPPIPQRPDGDPGSELSEDEEEKPVVVVIQEGKHLTEREAENIKRHGEYRKS